MIGQCIATRLDIFCWGVVLGVLSVLLGQWLQQFLVTMVSIDQKKLDLELGKALLKMKRELEKPRNE